MTESTVNTNIQGISIALSDDKLQASVLVSKSAATALDEAKLHAALKEAGITITTDTQQRVEEFVKLVEDSESTPNEPFLIAVGTPAFEGKNEEFVWDEAYSKNAQEWQGDDPVNHYSFNSIVTVEANALIGTIAPLQPPESGRNVVGEIIEPVGEPKPLGLHPSIKRDINEPSQLFAGVSGKVVCKNQTLIIEEVVSIDGDIDFESGNIDASTSVFISGSIHDKFSVKSRKSITVGGAIEAAYVEVADEICVRGGILGRNQGKVRCGGPLTAKFAAEAYLHVGDDLTIAKELMNCRTFTKGKLLATNAAVIGGTHFAAQGMAIDTIGSDANVPTRLAVGVHPAVYGEIIALEQSTKPKLQTIEKIRTSVGPLMNNLKRLNPAQREQATELLFKADEIEMEVNEIKEAATRKLTEGASDQPVSLFVQHIIYPATVISIDNRMTTINKPMKGPIQIECRKINNVTEFVAVNKLTASRTLLKSEKPPVEHLVRGFECEKKTQPDEASDPASEQQQKA